MRHLSIPLSLWALVGLMACGTKTSPVVNECGEGMGRADDGICYPLAGYGDAGTNAPTEDSGGGGDGGDSSGDGSGGEGSGGNSDGETGSSSSVSIQISGVIVFDATTGSAANCNISSWVAEAVSEETGLPDRGEYSESDLQFFSCSDHGGGEMTYSLDILVDDSTEVAFYAFIDPDGDASTADFRAAADNNPMTVVGGESYTGVNFTVSGEGG